MKKTYRKPLAVSPANISGGLPTVLAIGAVAAVAGAAAAAVGVGVAKAMGYNPSIHADKTTSNFIIS
ncbi:MAG: hypothetical protein LBH00_10105 [Planctomycetaceae bacterium]|jgi:hypothetical protein|nr:hypothetical protein [Planctomycetaceae bacterium]